MPHTNAPHGRIMQSLIELRYLDSKGELQVVEIRSTNPPAVLKASAPKLQPLVEGWIKNTGATFLSMQLIDQVPRSA